MKKSLLLVSLLAIALVACNKKEEVVPAPATTEVHVQTPTQADAPSTTTTEVHEQTPATAPVTPDAAASAPMDSSTTTTTTTK